MSQYNYDSSTRQYLKEISKTALLTPEEESALAERIQNGDEKARSQMIQANLRLVVKIANDYTGYGLPLSDLISEGNLGLMRAVGRFDPNRGAKLSSYASWWIKQSIKRALANQGKTVRLPAHMLDKLSKVRRISTSMTEALGREPTDEELSEETGVPVGKLARLRRVSQGSTSLDAPVNEDKGVLFADVIGDESAVDPFEALDWKNLHDELDGMLDVLDERESRIIGARFGLEGVTPMTLEEVGREFGVSRERIRQVQTTALAKMRSVLRKKDNPVAARAPLGAM
jgi:RNA polymerase primary sigma factor